MEGTGVTEDLSSAIVSMGVTCHGMRTYPDAANIGVFYNWAALAASPSWSAAGDGRRLIIPVRLPAPSRARRAPRHLGGELGCHRLRQNSFECTCA